MEYIYEKIFTMRKNEENFSNIYYMMEMVRTNKLLEIRFVGRWNDKDNFVQYLPKEAEFEECICENGKLILRFKYEKKLMEVIYPLTNRKEDRE